MKNIAIIPARSGSKGLKNKNIKLLNGKPLIAYTIEAALASNMFDEVMVSTDSVEYAHIAKEYGAAVPFLRSEKTSSDTASSWEMVSEVLGEYKKLGKEFDTFCLLQPTSPLRDEEDIVKAYEVFFESASVGVVSVCETEHSPMFCNQLPENKELTDFIKRSENKRRQEMGTFYRINGAIYIFSIDEFEKDNFLYRKGSYAYVMEKEKSIDIDTAYDFKIAEYVVIQREKDLNIVQENC